MSAVLPVLVLFVFGYALILHRPLFSDFCDGVQEGLRVCLSIFPTLLLVLTAVGVFRSSGAMEGMTRFLAPVCQWLSLPSELLPLALVRPLSGGGALSFCESLLRRYGADSLIGRMGAVLSASTETTFYVFALYLPKGTVRGSGRFLFCALLCDLLTLLLTLFVCRLFWR